ncbi:MAG: hypothetical protein ACXW18_00945 [Pyrinomonadaceae bacterium]
MRSKYKRSFTAVTLLILLAVMQAYAGTGLATRNSNVTDLSAAPQQISGILTTQANKPITVNGASAATGATILSGAMIETPDGVTATISIPGHGTLEIAANTKLTLEIDQNGNIKVNLIQGCLVLRTMKGSSGEVDNAQGVIGKTDSSKNDELNVCPGVKTAGAAAGGGGLSTGAKVAIVAAVGGGLGAALAFGLRGSNPSPGAP